MEGEEEKEESLLAGRPCCQQICLSYEEDAGERTSQTDTREGEEGGSNREEEEEKSEDPSLQ